MNALLSAQEPHHFLGIDQEGRTCIIETRGNRFGHIILRGGQNRPNYDPVSVAMTEEQLEREGLAPLIMVDCSHDNSGKRPKLQAHVMKSVLQQRLDGNTSIIGVMIESNLSEGKQPVSGERGLRHGVSITDACIGWETTEQLLRFAHDELASGAHAGVLRSSF
jgi:3-deoxy-7-phosphoheptulonate synthase